MNISSVVNRIIQNVGRFTENYAGDVLIELSHIYAMTKPHKIEPGGESVVIGIGIRENGVDHNQYIMKRLAETANESSVLTYPVVQKYYRKVLAVEITNQKTKSFNDVYCTVKLFDITKNLGQMTKEDMEWDECKQVEKHLKEKPECAGEEWNNAASLRYQWELQTIQKMQS
jgi:hypothetical protein